jgi:hypothetical protein
MSMSSCQHDANGNLAAITRDVIPLLSVGRLTDEIVQPGGTATFSAIVSDARGATFQWLFNHSRTSGGESPIAGATGDSLLLTNVGEAQVGEYRVVVTSGATTMRSLPATLLLDHDGDGVPDDPPVPLPPRALAFWRFENDAADMFGGHNGNFFNSAHVPVSPPFVAAKAGSGVVLDGNTYAQVANSADLRPPEMTAEAWAFPTRRSSIDHQAFIARGSQTGNEDAWWMGLFDGRLRFWSQHLQAGVVSQSHMLENDKFQLPLNQWSHVAISFDGATKRLYANGSLIASASSYPEPPGSTRQPVRLGPLDYGAGTPPVTIGSDFGTGSGPGPGKPVDFFTGRLDEVALYDRALRSYEVWEIYSAGDAGKTAVAPYFTSPAGLPDAVVSIPYTHNFSTVLGEPPVTFALAVGTLQPGLTLSDTGVLSGACAVAGTFDFIVRATDKADRATEQLCTLQVFDPVAAPAGLVGGGGGKAMARIRPASIAGN